MAIGESAGILFTIKADADQAKRELGAVSGSISDVGAASLASVNPLTLASTAIAAMGTAAITASVAIFKLVESTAEYGSAIFDASQKTGLGTESLSALRYAAETSGSSFEKVTSAVSKFSVLLGQAELGNAKAVETLARYGVTAKDIDGALSQAVLAIARMTSSTERSAAAQALFKDRTAEILPVIESFKGDLPGLIARLTELGIIMTKDGAEKSDEFGDSLDTLKMQAAGVGRAFALELMPQMTSALQSISQSITDNKGIAQEWARELLIYIKGVQAVFEGLSFVAVNSLSLMTGGMINSSNAAVSWSGVVRAALSSVTFGFSEVVRAIGEAKNAYDRFFGNGVTASGEGSILQGKIGGTFTPTAAAPSRGGGRSPISAASVDNTPERNRTASLQIQGNNLKLVFDELNDVIDTSLDKFKEFGTSDRSVALVSKEIDRLESNLQTVLADIEALENQTRDTLTVEERTLLTQNQTLRRDTESAKITKARKELEEQTAKARQIDNDIQSKYLEREIEKNFQRIQQERELLRLKQEQTDLALQQLRPGEGVAPGMSQADLEAAGLDLTIFDQLANSWDAFVEKMQASAPTVTSTITSIGQMFQNAFQGMANALGQVVQQWVLYGDTGPNVMRKILASALASIAAEAAVRAIYSAALGFFYLATGNYQAATNAFIAAAVFGSIGVGSALAGRAVAGDAFKRETSTSASGGAIAGQSGSLNYTTAFGGYGSPLNNLIERQTVVLGQVEETVHQFNTKVTSMPPDHVVALGAAGASRDIRDAYESELSSDPAATENFMRRAGLAR